MSQESEPSDARAARRQQARENAEYHRLAAERARRRPRRRAPRWLRHTPRPFPPDILDPSGDALQRGTLRTDVRPPSSFGGLRAAPRPEVRGASRAARRSVDHPAQGEPPPPAVGILVIPMQSVPRADATRPLDVSPPAARAPCARMSRRDVRRDRRNAVGVHSIATPLDGRWYVLVAAPSLRGRLVGIHVDPSDAPMQVGAGGRDGDSVALDVLLQLRLDAGRFLLRLAHAHRAATEEHGARVGLERSDAVEPMTGIEPACPAWEAGALPLSYIGTPPGRGPKRRRKSNPSAVRRSSRHPGFAPEASPSHQLCSGAQVKVLASGEKVRRGWRGSRR